MKKLVFLPIIFFCFLDVFSQITPYYDNVPLEKQVKIIAEAFGLDSTVTLHRIRNSKNLLDNYSLIRGEYVAIPKISKMFPGESPEVQYGNAVKKIVALLKQKGLEVNEDCVDYIKPHSKLNYIIDNEKQKGDIAIIYVYSVNKDRERGEFYLNFFELGCFILTHQESDILSPYNSLSAKEEMKHKSFFSQKMGKKMNYKEFYPAFGYTSCGSNFFLRLKEKTQCPVFVLAH